MRRSSLTTLLLLGLLATSVRADDADPTLTSLELKWLRAGWPVLTYAEEQQLPIDIVVQPAAETGAAPLAASVRDGRCKLVLSMRNNGDVEAILTGLPAELHAVAIEAMTAHELAHCWRYLNGMWRTLPAGFVEIADASETGSDLATLRRTMRETRREEGFADLVGLAWTFRAHPQHYTMIHAWFEQVRADQPVTGSSHDTRTWLQLVAQPDAFTDTGTPFEQAHRVWSRGLLQH
jgi:hypothetical protein